MGLLKKQQSAECPDCRMRTPLPKKVAVATETCSACGKSFCSDHCRDRSV